LYNKLNDVLKLKDGGQRHRGMKTLMRKIGDELEEALSNLHNGLAGTLDVDPDGRNIIQQLSAKFGMMVYQQRWSMEVLLSF
jgi:hypothetical protein